MKETMLIFIQHYGYAAVFTSMMAGIIGLPLPVEVLLIFVGSIAAAAHLQPIWLIAFAWLGTIAGMSVNYGLGKVIGIESFGKFTKYIHIPEEKLNRLAGRREFDILVVFMQNPNIVLSRRDVLIKRIWGYNTEVETNVVDMYGI